MSEKEEEQTESEQETDIDSKAGFNGTSFTMTNEAKRVKLNMMLSDYISFLEKKLSKTEDQR